MRYKGYIKLEHEVEAESEEQAKEKIADYWDDVLLTCFDSSSVELEPENSGIFKEGQILSLEGLEKWTTKEAGKIKF